MAAEAVATRRRIIRRPRLTKLLDESPARIKLLIAPAGYGKTTLAQEWLGEPDRRDVWYRAGPAAADVAALAAGIALAASEVVPDAGRRMRERLRATGDPEEDVDVLAELLAEDIEPWPAGTWFAMDDYQFAMDSPASERFLELLVQRTSVSMVVTSRRRPTWATARRILYGEIQEVDRRMLAMTDAEGASVLGRPANEVGDLLSKAKGWAAIIGLAALTGSHGMRRFELSPLDQFFSEELLNSLDSEGLRGVGALALAPTLTDTVAELVLGKAAATTVAAALRLGILTQTSPGLYEVHPLLRDHLIRLSANERPTKVLRKVVDLYLLEKSWDDAFDLAKACDPHSSIPIVVQQALDPLLSEGRLATLKRWLEQTFELQVHDPILDLADAEIAFRLNDHTRAEQLAAAACEELTDLPLVTRALVRAGYAALLASREKEALAYFGRTRELGPETAVRREALLGEYYASSELGDPAASSILDEAAALDDTSPGGRLRLEVMRLTRANRRGGLVPIVDEAASRRHLVERIRDPLGTTAFLHALATGLNLVGRYDEALEVAERLLNDAEDFRLALPVPHGLLDKAIAELGLRRSETVLRTLNRVRDVTPRSDHYLEALATFVHARSFLCQRNAEAALDLLAQLDGTLLSAPARAELEGWRGYAFAATRQLERAEICAVSAEIGVDASVEARVLVSAIKVFCAAGDLEQRVELVARLWDDIRSTGNVDTFVTIYRSAPALLVEIGRTGREVELISLVGRLGDLRLARAAGLIPQETGGLTAREREVSELLQRGLTNKEMAEQLFISQATVKVHLRHIYEKLGVRNRASAIARLR